MPDFMTFLRGAGNLSAARRCVFMLLLVIVPFQLAWSAASPYCGHEGRADAPHFGHHDHQGKSHAADSGQGTKLKQMADGDDNCISCHASPAQRSAETVLPTMASRAGHPPDGGLHRYRSPVPPGLERPARRFAT